MNETEIVSKMLLGFFADMHLWETAAYQKLQENPDDYGHFKNTFQQAAEEVQIIYKKYLTDKPRKYTVRGNSLSSKPAYDTINEEIKIITQKTKSRIEIETLQKTSTELQHCYVFLKQNGEWRIDNKKTFWIFKNKWESTVI